MSVLIVFFSKGVSKKSQQIAILAKQLPSPGAKVFVIYMKRCCWEIFELKLVILNMKKDQRKLYSMLIITTIISLNMFPHYSPFLAPHYYY